MDDVDTMALPDPIDGSLTTSLDIPSWATAPAQEVCLFK
jgi:hypothetical protein